MPSAWKDRNGWLAQYHGLTPRADGKQHRQRIPADRLRGDDPAALAKAYAEDCAAACARLRGPHRSSDIHAARDLGAISYDQAEALIRGLPPPDRIPAEPTTLEQAFLAHPSSQRTNADGERRRYLGLLAQFQTWAQIEHVEYLTLTKVQEYLAHLRALGHSWDYRRHHLLPLRRAAKMAAVRWGLPDVLGELTLDHRERRVPVQAWTLDELATACDAFTRSGDHRALVATALGGFVGLRPSEIYRLRIGDLRSGGRLAIGLDVNRDAKNEPSRRLLPLPPTIARWWRTLAAKRPGDEPLIVNLGGRQVAEPGKPTKRQSHHFNESTFGHWLRPRLATETGRALPVKTLRKSFATWATRARLPSDHREAYLGHETNLAASITGQHYIADLWEIVADELQPTAELIESILTEALAKVDLPTGSPTVERKAKR